MPGVSFRASARVDIHATDAQPVQRLQMMRERGGIVAE